MRILKDFDLAIAEREDTPGGYVTDKGTYDSYMANAAWEALLSGMCATHRGQYGGGSGGELKEKNGCPPKMASFASSSRMIYLLSKDIPGFEFEKQLSTVIGGVANLDGYWKGNDEFVFVEAKCRESYSHKSPEIIKKNYKPLYRHLQNIMPDVFSCVMEDIPGANDVRVTFFCRGNQVVFFDIKQMLCHLLGIANKMLLDNTCDIPIRFIYLLYNPTDLAIPEKSRKEVMTVYRAVCEAAENYNFQRIFAGVVDFLMEKKEYPATRADAEKLKQNFFFSLCDQKQYGDVFDGT